MFDSASVNSCDQGQTGTDREKRNGSERSTNRAGVGAEWLAGQAGWSNFVIFRPTDHLVHSLAGVPVKEGLATEHLRKKKGIRITQQQREQSVE